MDFTHLLVLLSAAISILGSYAYIKDTVRGKTKPNRVSWCMWALAPLVGTGAAISAGAEPWTVVRVFLAGFLPLLVFISSFFNRQSYWKITTFDFFCGCMSFAAFVVWLLMSNPVIAILLAAIADGFASMPTLIKAWRFPETETGSAYIASFVSVVLVLPLLPIGIYLTRHFRCIFSLSIFCS